MRDPRRHPEARVPLPTRVPLAQLQQVADLVAPVVAAELGPLQAGPHRLELARPGLQLMGGHARDYKRGGGSEVRPHVLRPISGPMLLDLLFLTGYRGSAGGG